MLYKLSLVSVVTLERISDAMSLTHRQNVLFDRDMALSFFLMIPTYLVNHLVCTRHKHILCSGVTFLFFGNFICNKVECFDSSLRFLGLNSRWTDLDILQCYSSALKISLILVLKIWMDFWRWIESFMVWGFRLSTLCDIPRIVADLLSQKIN